METTVVTLILATSIVLQLCAAGMALWLIRITGRRFTWIAIAAAILLMSVRRVIALVHLPTGHTIHQPDLAAEVVGLVISILMLAGVATIGPLLATIQKSRIGLLLYQKVLRQSEERFRELAELAPQAIIEMDTEGRFRWANEKATEYSGHSADELFGTLVTDQVIPEDRARLMNHMDRILSGQQPGPVEYTACRKDGSTYPVETHGSAILRDGHAAGLKALVIDITDRKRIAEEKRRLAAVAEQTAEGIAVADLAGNIQYANHAWAAMHGYENGDELVGEHLSIFHTEEQLKTEVIPFNEELKRRGFNIGEVGHSRKDGTVFPTTMTTTVLVDDQSTPYALAAFARDITAHKRRQAELAQARRLETAGQVAGQVAHDFNNLLGPLVAYPEMARLHLPTDSPVHRMLDTIESSAVQMAEISQELLTLSRRGHYNVVPLDLNEIIDETLLTAALPATVDVSTQFDPDLFPCRGGKAQLQRVLLNLINNARDAIKGDGHISITTDNVYLDKPLTRRTRIEKGEYVRVRIADNGSGIPPEIIDRVFDPFFTTKTADKQRGTGLGLSVVHSVMEDHEGCVDVDSTPGLGTTVGLYFPICREGVTPMDDPAELPRGSEQLVLVVDDDPIQRQVARDALGELGYNISTAASGEKAVQMVHVVTYDILLLDMVMNGIDGLETFRRIRAIHPRQIALLMSGYAPSDRVEEAMTIGVTEFLAKPIRIPVLANAIHRALQGSAAVCAPAVIEST